jgi:signal transduction histidine kinase
MRGVRLALAELLVVAAGIAGIELALYAYGTPAPRWAVSLFPVVGFVFVAAGVLAWDRRPSNRTGALLCLGGFSIFAAGLVNTIVPGLIAVGLLFSRVPLPVILHILLAFPSGRLSGVLPRVLVAAAYTAAIVLESPRYLFSSNPPPYDVFEVAHSADLMQAGIRLQEIAGGTIFVLSALVLLRLLRAAERTHRRVLAPVYAYGVAALLFLLTSARILPEFGASPVPVFVLQMAALAGLPIAFALGVLFGRFARTGEIEELGAWLGAEERGRPGLRDALARTLGDDSLVLAFWRPSGGYVTADGLKTELPTVGSGRGAVEVELAGERIGAIVYDAQLISEPELVRQAGRVIALALERERLTADVYASREALRESRARIAATADLERRRIAQDLHDGLQGKLVVLALQAGRIADRPTVAEPLADDLRALRTGLEAASDEVRHLVQGVMPALLIERGLCAATEDLADRMPLPIRLEVPDDIGTLPAAVESTGYFVVAEALTNAVKHSQAHELAVRLAMADERLEIDVADDGVGGATIHGEGGLHGIADRLDVLGGTLLVDSPPGRGTHMHAELPCAS